MGELIDNQNQKNAEADVVKETITTAITDYPVNKETRMYISKAIPTVIKFSSRASIKITNNGQDHYYTVEYGEERQINNYNDVNIAKERQFLIDDCNNIVDGQVKEIVETFLR